MVKLTFLLCTKYLNYIKAHLYMFVYEGGSSVNVILSQILHKLACRVTCTKVI